MRNHWHIVLVEGSVVAGTFEGEKESATEMCLLAWGLGESLRIEAAPRCTSDHADEVDEEATAALRTASGS